MNFNPSPLSPNFKKLGNYQKQILRQMARKGHIISVVMDNSSNHSDEIQLQDRGGDNFFQKVEKKLLESMGKRGLFDQHVFNMSLHLTIVKFHLKDKVKKQFIN